MAKRIDYVIEEFRVSESRSTPLWVDLWLRLSRVEAESDPTSSSPVSVQEKVQTLVLHPAQAEALSRRLRDTTRSVVKKQPHNLDS